MTQLGIPAQRDNPFSSAEARQCQTHGNGVPGWGCAACIRYDQELRCRAWLATGPSLPVCRPTDEDEWGEDVPVECGYPMAPVDFGQRGDGTLVLHFECPTHEGLDGAEAEVEIR